MSITVRTYQSSDLNAVLNVVKNLQAFEIEMYDRMMPVENIGEWYISTLLEQCSREEGTILVAEKENEIIGYATIFTNVQQEGEIDELPFIYANISHISILPSARGMGVGKLLMNECENMAKLAGCKWLRLGVLAKNTSARQIYEHLGFENHHITMEKIL